MLGFRLLLNGCYGKAENVWEELETERLFGSKGIYVFIVLGRVFDVENSGASELSSALS